MPAATSAGSDRAAAVHVVGAPPAEPRTVVLLDAQQPVHTALGDSVAGQPSAASISTTCAVTSADGGSITAPKSQNGSLVVSVLGVVGVERAPAAVLGLHADQPAHTSVDARPARPAWSVLRNASTTSAVSSVSG